MNDRSYNKLGLYVHWPFCLLKCPYCDFNSHKIIKYNDEEWLKAYLSQLESVKELFDKYFFHHQSLSSIFFGGGTPSLMRPNLIEKIIEKAYKIFGFNNNIEITLEANPSSIEFQNIREFKTSGINRLSLGVQSLNDHDLLFLGRLHKSIETKEIIKLAIKVFDNISVDLIYGLPFQDSNVWRKELSHFIKNYQLQHISAYQLTFEKGTKFYDMYKKKQLIKINDSLSLKFYNSTIEILEQGNFYQYEISNFSKLNYESKHNKLYWNSENWFGIGPGAVSRFWNKESKRIEIQNFKKPLTWLKKASNSIKGFKNIIEIEDDISDKEILIMGLRLINGIDINKLKKREFLKTNSFRILQSNNLIKIKNEKIMVNKKDLIKLNYILNNITDTI